jgi:CheY-like chemotaxis protein
LHKPAQFVLVSSSPIGIDDNSVGYHQPGLRFRHDTMTKLLEIHGSNRYSVYASRMPISIKYPPAVLVVEDDTLIQLLIARALEKVGFQVFAAGNTAEAGKLTALYAHRIVLLLVDVVLGYPEFRVEGQQSLPEGDGARLLPRLHAVCPHAVAVQMSAYTPDELAIQGYRIEARHFLQKPFTVAKLRGLVEGFLSDLPLDPDAMIPLAEIPWCG